MIEHWLLNILNMAINQTTIDWIFRRTRGIEAGKNKAGPCKDRFEQAK